MTFQYEAERIFAVDETGRLIAEVTFPVRNGLANISHTFVDDSLRGQGVAALLMEAAVNSIRERKLKAKLTCSYAIKWFEGHPEHYDLLYWSCDQNRC
ncbi:MAG: hypothetical protein H6Q61_20 [Firmicutes bacterium]|nr:hypothetical protein [Bacillota bacterium]